MASMTDYERQRLENMRRNQEMLDALRVPSAAQQLRAASIKPTKKRSFSKVAKGSEEPTIIRRSLRTRGINPDSDFPLELKHSPTKQSHASKSVRTQLEQISKEGPLDFAKCFVPGTDDEVFEPFFERIRDAGDEMPLAAFKGRVDVSLQLEVGDLKMEDKDRMRVAPSRIFCLQFLPCKDRSIVVSGDKSGNLSLWDADFEKECLHVFSIHESPITEIAVAPFSLHKVLTCSYDGRIRYMDIEKQVFDLLHDNGEGVSAMSCVSDNNNLIYFGSGGDLKILDQRTRLSSVENTFALHDRKINSLDFHPQNQYLFATSSTDSTAKIWDARKLKKSHNKSLAIVQHAKAVHSAFFSPSGMHMATTSYDNSIGLSSRLESLTTTKIYHYHPPNRWISSFRSIWGWDDEHLLIGNMSRGLDIISTSTKMTSTFTSPFITAIPTRLAKHPLKPGILAGATAGGQVYIWHKK